MAPSPPAENLIALLTGATGFIGSAILRSLIDSGYEVRVLVRPSSDRRNLAGQPAEIREGDITRPGTLRDALRGCRYLFHAAAEYRLWHPQAARMYEANVDGTRNIMRAALDAGVERIVHTSSVATLGLRSDGLPADEATPVDVHDMIGHYKRSKYLAEEEVRRLVRDEGLPAVIVNPTAPMGPGDIRPTPTGRVILDAAAGRTPAYVDTGLNVVHVDDVAMGHILALTSGTPGERYILGGENLTLREILCEVAAITGGRTPRLKLRPWMVMPFAYIAQAWAGITGGGEPRITIDAVRMARKRMFFSSEKARRELGYHPRPAARAIRDAVEWFGRKGYLACSREPAGMTGQAPS